MRILLQILVFVLSVLPFSGQVWGIEISELSVLSVNSAITPATYDYLKQNFKQTPESTLIVLKLNTPGGLVTTTKDIITLVGRENRPFAVWITPEGASASSAGAIIASSAHFIFMSPGTNMGAATPVGLGEDLKEGDARKKVMNDLTALVRSLSQSRGRPSGPFEKMITEAESFTDQEAMKAGIIEGVISHENEILPLIQGKSINLGGDKVVVDIKNNVAIKYYEQTPGQKLLEVLANPTTAYILFLIGIALIYFEFQAPGGFIAGSVGLCFLILAAISFQVLPLDWGSMGLIILGVFLLILEIFIVSYGILTIAGLISFIMGSLFLFHGEGGFISVQYPAIISSLLGVALAVGLVVWYIVNDKKKQKVTNDFFLPIGAKGSVLSQTGPLEYQVKVRGEIWRASSDEELKINEPISVLEANPKTLHLKIKKES